MKTDSNGNYINDDSKGYNKRKITVSISGASYKTTFDTDD